MPEPMPPRDGAPLTPSAEDPGRTICQHEARHHYLGGGIWVCFKCWASMLLGRRVT